MKTKITALAAGLGMYFMVGCDTSVPESEIPSVVLNAFNLEFEETKEVEWEKHSNLYTVEFEFKDKDHEALIDENGKLLKYKKELQLSELSDELKTTLDTGFSEMQIEDIDLLVLNDNQYYQIEFDGKISNGRKVFNSRGEEMDNVIYFD